ncbi:hypothetical protein pdam_00021316 [Pocillopora damicornis]|uniref:Uncharacterized protein n=1 Tax=Pocillopora damicornis TaxID=46731 RepID=A0A3M6V387_POCDA|nr:hypothetical protein pdam_00021316 [Pocillopora damicornis]
MVKVAEIFKDDENLALNSESHVQSGSSQDGVLPTPLHAAAVNGNKSLLQRLLQEACYFYTQGNVKCVKLLLSKGANWKVKDNKGRTPLHFATSHQSPKCLSILLKRVPKGEADEPDNDEMTSLHWSVSYGNAEHVKLLLKAGCSVTVTDLEKRTPLHWAITNPDPAVVKLILEANSDIVNHQDNEGRTALHLAVAEQNEAAVKVLLALDKCKVSAQDNMSRSPLHWAAVLGNSQLVKMLLERNADFTAADSNGATALHYVAQSNYCETVKVFLSFDKVNDIPDNEGRTALMWAAGKGSESALKTMLEHNLDVHAKDKLGGTALHSAAYSGHVNCVKLLIQFGACVDALDMLQHTPIFRACEMGHTEVVNNLILLGKRATNLFVFSSRLTPLDYAIIGDHQDVAQYMIEQGALTINGIQDIAATTVQKCWRGYTVRKAFQDKKNLFLRHEQLKGQKRASAARTGDIFGNQSPYSVSPGSASPRDFTKTDAFDNERHLQVFTEDFPEENMEEALPPFTEERRHSQNESTSKDKLLTDNTCPRDYTERHVTNVLQEAKVDESWSSSESPSSGRKSEDRFHFKNDAEMVRVVSSLLLEEDFELDEGFSFANEGENTVRRVNVTKNDPPRLAPAKKLHSGISKAELARRERERLHLIRSKVNAAVLIQRWFRKWISMRRERFERDVVLSEVKNEQEELNKEVAALTIQLAWRKHYRLEFEKISAGTKQQKSKKPPFLSSASCKQKQNGIHIYGRPLRKVPSMNGFNSRNAFKRKPGSTKHDPASPAAMSYNMAMDLYHPLGSRQGNSRAAIVTSSTRVRPGSMKRTVNGWTHNIGFLSRISGHKTGSKDPKT